MYQPVLDPVAAHDAFRSAVSEWLSNDVGIYNAIIDTLPTEAAVLEAIQFGVRDAFIEVFRKS